MDVSFAVLAQGQTQNLHLMVREERREHLTALPRAPSCRARVPHVEFGHGIEAGASTRATVARLS